MIKKKAGEVWKQMLFAGYKDLRKKYAASNQGRVASYISDIFKDGKLLSGSATSGYRTLNLHVGAGNGTIYVHREVARLFCNKKSARQKYVLHLNHKKADNNYKNLKWATMEEVSIHQQSSPEKIAYKERQATRKKGLKLTIAQVKVIKETINNPKRKLTYKQIAAKYGVSEMTLYRIRSGENWGRV
jgi:uncharacterized lipoprotein YehR (DUF1307 family)